MPILKDLKPDQNSVILSEYFPLLYKNEGIATIGRNALAG